jgi:hypothetical protein
VIGFFKTESQELFSQLASNCDPPDLCLLSSWDYRRGHLAYLFYSFALQTSWDFVFQEHLKYKALLFIYFDDIHLSLVISPLPISIVAGSLTLFIQIFQHWPCTVVHICSSSTGSWSRKITWAKSLRPAWAT